MSGFTHVLPSSLIIQKSPKRFISSLSVNATREQTVGISLVVVKVSVLDAEPVAALERVTVVEVSIEEIVVEEGMLVPVTSISTANLLESATVKLVLVLLVVQDC